MISDQILLKKNSIEDENYKEIYNFDRLIQKIQIQKEEKELILRQRVEKKQSKRTS